MHEEGDAEFEGDVVLDRLDAMEFDLSSCNDDFDKGDEQED